MRVVVSEGSDELKRGQEYRPDFTGTIERALKWISLYRDYIQKFITSCTDSVSNLNRKLTRVHCSAEITNIILNVIYKTIITLVQYSYKITVSKLL